MVTPKDVKSSPGAKYTGSLVFHVLRLWLKKEDIKSLGPVAKESST